MMVKTKFIGLSIFCVFGLAACFTPELSSIEHIDASRIYIVSRISFENFQIDSAALAKDRRDCFVIFSAAEGDYRGVGFGDGASVVRTVWNKFFVHSLPKAGGDRPAPYFIESAYLALADETVPVLWTDADQFELLFDLRLDYGQDSACLYIGDIVFSMKGDDLFVTVTDHFNEARAYYESLWKDAAAKPAALEKRLLTGRDFVELRKTSNKPGKVSHKVFSPTF
jgi:hypothetical protein